MNGNHGGPVVLAIFALVAVASCGAPEKATPGDAGPDAASADALPGPEAGLDATFPDVLDEEDGGDGSGSSDGGAICGQCTSDMQCQQTCPFVAGAGTSCCDSVSGVCAYTTQTTCPAPVPACIIGGKRYASGALNPTDACQSCQPAASATAWTTSADGTICGTGNVCNAGRCGAGWTFGYTGAAQSLVVPSGVARVTITAYGASGPELLPSGPPSLGGVTTAVISVTPGETLSIFVGSQGGWSGGGGFNGGGAGHYSVFAGSGGGGASDVRQGGSTLANRVVVAGGGGGAVAVDLSAIPGGLGGGTTGGAGYGGGAGQGGTQSAGGMGGPASPTCVAGGSGTLGKGGDSSCGAGGGGGYYGGGGGGGLPLGDGGTFDGGGFGIGGTGGGGSSFAIATATGVSILQQVPSAWSLGASDGLVVITY